MPLFLMQREGNGGLRGFLFGGAPTFVRSAEGSAIGRSPEGAEAARQLALRAAKRYGAPTPPDISKTKDTP